MLNRFPLWNNLMVFGILIIGLLYALPNLYSDDPSVQISAKRGQSADVQTLTLIEKSLDEINIEPKSVSLNNGMVLVRLKKDSEQLVVREKISSVLGKDYSVALNLAPSTPSWLSSIGGKPMRRGLDLLGGVRFLMEVDMKTSLIKEQEALFDSLRSQFRKQDLRYQSLIKTDNYGIKILFQSEEIAKKAATYVKKNHQDLDINLSDNLLLLKPSEASLAHTRTVAIEQNLSILRKRVQELGVSEPTIQRQGADRIVVELPGVQDTARAKEILGATATLEFRLVNTNANQALLSQGIVPADSEIKYDRDGRSVLLYRKTEVGGEHIIDASAGRNQESSLPQVSIKLDSEGGDLMAQTTKMALGKPMATLYREYKDSGKRDKNGKVILDKVEEVINVATIQGRFGSQFQITGINSSKEAQNLAVLLRSGALIAPIVIVQERTIGASLGADNVKQGIDAALLGLVLTILFCLVVYKMFGVFATAALCFNMVLTIGAMSLIGATLTMPGIAGIVLSVGMSVDANVLIYERIKEELRLGRGIQQAISEGYNGAFSSIFDSNLTTILTSLILYAVGTGPIKGFAVTLSLGVLISMFTAITGTRMLVNFMYGGKRVKKLWI